MKLFVFISSSECANFLHHSYLVVLVVLMCAQKTFGSLLALSNDVLASSHTGKTTRIHSLRCRLFCGTYNLQEALILKTTKTRNLKLAPF